MSVDSVEALNMNIGVRFGSIVLKNSWPKCSPDEVTVQEDGGLAHPGLG
jgi:hypothetical protein